MNFYINSGLDNLQKAKLPKADLQTKLDYIVLCIIFFKSIGIVEKVHEINSGKKQRRHNVKCVMAILQPHSLLLSSNEGLTLIKTRHDLSLPVTFSTIYIQFYNQVFLNSIPTNSDYPLLLILHNIIPF